MSKKPPKRRSVSSALVVAVTLLGCTGSSTPRVSSGELVERFKDLHQALYGVYALGTDRDLIWELLDSSFAGDALTQQYIEHFTTLTQMKAENTAIEVLNVDYEEVEIVERAENRVVVEADWSVGGIVTHQSHKHPRVNRYRALYTLASAGPASPLRIIDTRMRDLERVQTLDTHDEFPLDNVPRSARGLLTAEDLLRSGVLEPEP